MIREFGKLCSLRPETVPVEALGEVWFHLLVVWLFLITYDHSPFADFLQRSKVKTNAGEDFDRIDEVVIGLLTDT